MFQGRGRGHGGCAAREHEVGLGHGTCARPLPHSWTTCGSPGLLGFEPPKIRGADPSGHIDDDSALLRIGENLPLSRGNAAVAPNLRLDAT